MECDVKMGICKVTHENLYELHSILHSHQTQKLHKTALKPNH